MFDCGEVHELGSFNLLVELVPSAFFFFFFFFTDDVHNCLWILHFPESQREREVGFEKVVEKRSVFERRRMVRP